MTLLRFTLVSEGSADRALIPVRALEAWFLFDEPAIRRAAGNPSGRQPLVLPLLKDVEAISSPKEKLEETMRVASGLEGRRRRKLEVGSAVHRLADLIEDFGPLRNLAAFAAFEQDLADALSRLRSARPR